MAAAGGSDKTIPFGEGVSRQRRWKELGKGRGRKGLGAEKPETAPAVMSPDRVKAWLRVGICFTSASMGLQKAQTAGTHWLEGVPERMG